MFRHRSMPDIECANIKWNSYKAESAKKWDINVVHYLWNHYEHLSKSMFSYCYQIILRRILQSLSAGPCVLFISSFEPIFSKMEYLRTLPARGMVFKSRTRLIDVWDASLANTLADYWYFEVIRISYLKWKKFLVNWTNSQTSARTALKAPAWNTWRNRLPLCRSY